MKAALFKTHNIYYSIETPSSEFLTSKRYIYIVKHVFTKPVLTSCSPPIPLWALLPFQKIAVSDGSLQDSEVTYETLIKSVVFLSFPLLLYELLFTSIPAT